MKTPTDSKEALMDSIIDQATQYGSIYTDKEQAHIAAKGYAVGYQQALSEKNIQVKELAGIVKLLLPGIGLIPPDNLKIIEEFIEKSEIQGT